MYFSQVFLISSKTYPEVDKINITLLIKCNVSEIKYPKYEKYSKHDRKKKPGFLARIGIFFQNAKRILKIANKPNRKDYFTVFKICAIGIVVLGALSFIIQLIFNVVGFGV